MIPTSNLYKSFLTSRENWPDVKLIQNEQRNQLEFDDWSTKHLFIFSILLN